MTSRQTGRRATARALRTLLVDNHDSFTYNLHHYLTEIDGREPEVVRNDDPSWRHELLADFDAVVISPGPGTPWRDRDLGISREIVRRAERPTLGVCLGHQAIAALHGGRVDRAPEPYHGRVSPIRHEGAGLFSGLPSPLPVVRYHSLAARDLPPHLRVTAWTPDGVVMGLRHLGLPLWGVQFHPESVGGADGHQLLANFLRLAELHHARRGGLAPRSRPVAPSAKPAGPVTPAAQARTVAPRPAGAGRRLRVLARQVPVRWEAEDAFARLFGRSDHSYWLDSSAPGGDLGRFSMLGDTSGPFGRTVTADVWSNTVTVRSRTSCEVVTGPFLDWLDQDLRGIVTDIPALPCDFALGWVGCLGYELKAECGGGRAHRSSDPDAALVFSDRGLVVDHATSTGYLLALAEDGREHRARAWLEGAARDLAGLPGACQAPPARRPAGTRVHARHGHEGYLGLVARCQDLIAAGETYETCLTNMLHVRADLDVWQSYRTLRRACPAPFGALLRMGSLSVLSTSPERFVRVDRQGVAESRPIKGTRPRSRTEQEDRELARELGASEKDRAENLMIVDLMRHDLGRCATAGSVEAHDILRVETYARAHQMVSTVRARLRPERTAVDCVRAAFPPGSMTGAPKERTMAILDDLEGGPRGLYSGALGYFSLTGAVDLSVVIRTAVVTPGLVRYGVGGAVTALSDPEEEFQETAVKAVPFGYLFGAASPGGVWAGPEPDAVLSRWAITDSSTRQPSAERVMSCSSTSRTTSS
ncbi:aminodeoxychorismate synthase component I [Streptomyces sp.]|uniref:aminodeoxychorismate synthase component I n=1 Tax=Streptomyces sp. TaxID=1931 RepID=UPI002F40C489